MVNYLRYSQDIELNKKSKHDLIAIIKEGKTTLDWIKLVQQFYKETNIEGQMKYYKNSPIPFVVYSQIETFAKWCKNKEYLR